MGLQGRRCQGGGRLGEGDDDGGLEVAVAALQQLAGGRIVEVGGFAEDAHGAFAQLRVRRDDRDHEVVPGAAEGDHERGREPVEGELLRGACLEARGFSQEDFARSHPGGALGRQLLTLAQDVMRAGPALPVVQADTLVPDALATMSAKGMGMTIVVDDDHKPIGIFTDGDLRRLISRQGDIRYTTVTQGMTRDPRSIAPQTLAIEAARLMDTQRINQILIVDTVGKLLGALHMHDLLAAKVI